MSEQKGERLGTCENYSRHTGTFADELHRQLKSCVNWRQQPSPSPARERSMQSHACYHCGENVAPSEYEAHLALKHPVAAPSAAEMTAEQFYSQQWRIPITLQEDMFGAIFEFAEAFCNRETASLNVALDASRKLNIMRQAAVAQLTKERDALRCLFHDLTPGSEFVNDPKYCAEYIRKRSHQQHETTVTFAKRAKEASERAERAESALAKARNEALEEAADLCRKGATSHIGCLAYSPRGDQYVPSGGSCHAAMADAILALKKPEGQ